MAMSMSDHKEIHIAAKKSEEKNSAVQQEITYTYTWKEKGLFSSLDKPVDFRQQSPVFSSDTEKIHQWYISFFPNGKGQDAKGFVSLFLRLLSAPKEVPVRFKLSIKTLDGIDIHSRKLEQRFKPGGLAWGWYCFMAQQNLMAHLGRGEIFVQVTIKMELQEYKHRYPQNMASLLDNSRFSDVTLAVHGHKIPAHKIILAVRSEVFSDMFDKQNLKSKGKNIKISNLSLDIMQTMIRFMYTNTADIPDINTASELIKASSLYAIDELKTMCFGYLISKLEVSNVIEIYRIADTYDEEGLRDYAEEYICDHLQNIFEKEDPYVLLADKPKLLEKITKRLV